MPAVCAPRSHHAVIDFAQQAIDLEAAIVALRRDPENEFLLADVAALLLPLAKQWAYKVSLSQEDQDDARNEILMHLLESAKPKQCRRLNPRTGLPVAGFEFSGSVNSFFLGSAKNKAMDILKMRRRAWRREGALFASLQDFGTALFAQPEILSDMMQNRIIGSDLEASCR